MKRIFGGFAILLSSAWVLVAQEPNKALVLKGSVQGIGTSCIEGERIAEVRVYLQFHNESNSRVFLLPPSTLFGATMRFANDSGTGSVAVDVFRFNPYLQKPYGKPTNEDYDHVGTIARQLDKLTEPEPSMFHAIEPGGYYEFHDTLWPKSGFKIDFTPSKIPPGLNSTLRDRWAKQPCGVGRTAVTAEYSSFRIKYDLFLRKYTGATDSLKNLQSRWKSSGNLILASNDDISFETEEIFLNTNK